VAERGSGVNIHLWFPTLVGEADLPDAAAVNRGLAAYVRARARRERGEAERTTVQRGWQSDTRFLDAEVAEVRALRAFVDRTLATFLAEWGRAYHAPGAPRSFAFDYAGWAVLLGSDGFQHQHVHSRTDFIGVYCVEAPLLDPRTDQGCLTLVDPRGGRLATRPVWEREREAVRPVPGRLVLFPSFVPHRVEQFHGPGERITINFDVTVRA
jgi:uncharacterized protein (TIGR02466 family)